ncbi:MULTISPECIES: DNA cytosine methyltransferase [unclassified Bacillus (in: firmicutes)]|uniref:DNA cytosine methyltransferase n=1 Tax=unclassified Bacillus (in: firmicutes) TaxID=185979 RepID=UPI00197C8C74|nr:MULTISPECIES: DNA cytosine methyltransferase [unclassified Bacillus (in: firmicutes)]
MNAISLFSSSGIGDLGLRKNNIHTVANCELLPDRMKLFAANHTESCNFLGDINELKNDIINYYNDNFEEELFLVMATPPCQGMSPNGAGKLLSEFRKGLRPKLDERNRLIIPSLDIITALRPKWVIFENVPQMRNTVILDERDRMVNIIDYIRFRLGEDYVGTAEVVDVADYGVPQNRKRLITIFTRSENGKDFFGINKSFLPQTTHSQLGEEGKQKWVTVREAIFGLPKLDGQKGKEKDKDFHELHFVNTLDEKKYTWVKHTPEGETAFNNQCINPECEYDGNRRHGATKNKKDGINKFNTDTPLYCEMCGSLLPRPYVFDNKTGEKRLMKGYTSAYKRMKWDEPASTLTQNFQYACSDNKLHPEQNRVLSIYEATIIQSISDYDYSFEINGKMANTGLIRDSIGESVPPKLIDLICRNLISIEKGAHDRFKNSYKQLTFL